MAIKKKPEVKKPEPKKAVAKVAPPTSAVTPFDDERELDQGAGSESAGAADFAIPFLTMLQSGSPQALKGNPARIDGAEAGHFMDTVTGQLYEQVKVIPCAYKRVLNEWKARDEGGGFRGTHPWDEALAAKARDRDYRTAEDTVLTDTAQWYVMYEDDAGEWRPAVLGLTSTQLTQSRKWMSLIRSIKKTGKHGAYNPAMFSHVYILGSEAKSNDMGSWFGVTVSLDEEVKDTETYHSAKAFYESVVGGTVKMQEPTPERTPAVDEEENF